MKVLVGCLLSAFLGSVHFYSYAQTAPSFLKGRILTENHSPVDYATVILLKYSDSSIVKSVICGKTGLFRFDDVMPGSYIVLIHKIGYKHIYTGKYELTGSHDVDIGDIIIPVLNTRLTEVTVNDKRDYIEVKPNKTILNIDESILAAGNNIYDILNTAPGVRIINNTILLKGNQKALIMIDGKPLIAGSDEELADMLKNYQSDMISQVELIENPSAKFDAAGGGGVINIILKKDKEIGFKANITESAGAGQDYRTNSGINFNYNTRKFNLFGSYSFTDNKIQRFLNLDRIIDDGALQSNYNLQYHSITQSKNNNFNAGADYDVTPKQTIGVLIYGYSNQTGIDKNNTTYIKNAGVLDSDINTRSHIDRHITNLNYNLNYNGSFGKDDKSEVSADFDYSTYNRSSIELLQSDFFDVSGQTYRDPLFDMDNSPSNIKVRSEKVDFTQVISKTGSIGAGLKNNQVNSDNNMHFTDRADSGSYVTVPALTDHFVYNERINEAYVNYNDKFNKTGLTLGLRAEQTNSAGTSLKPGNTVVNNYFDLFPNIEINEPLGANNQLTVGYNRRITRPDYQDLNPFVAYIDQYAYSIGNPFLKPEYINTYEATDVYKDKYKVTISAIKTSDFFISIFQQNDATRVYTTTYKNIGQYYQYMAEFWVPVTIAKWWKVNAYLEGGYDHFVYKADSAGSSAFDMSVNIMQDFNIAEGLRAELGSRYDSPTFYGISHIKSMYVVRAGISKDIFGSNGSIKLAVSDIFNSDKYRYTSDYMNLNLTGMQKPGTRFVTATFTYRFGKQSVKNARKRVGGNVDDQQRLNGGNEN
jgi:iron complex outermembrane receptor protein